MQNFFKSDMYACWLTFVPFAQVLKSVQNLKTKRESK